MKTKSLINLWSIIFILLFVCLLIDASAQTPDAIEYRKYQYRICSQSDTISFDNKDFLFEQSLMAFFPDYDKLFNDRTEVAFMATGCGKDKGYTVNFIVKDSILYLKRVTPKNLYIDENSVVTKNSNWKKVTKEEIKPRVEKMTGRKFDIDGLIKADWVSGEFICGTDGKFNTIGFEGSPYTPKTLYKFVLKKGVLKKWTII